VVQDDRGQHERSKSRNTKSSGRSASDGASSTRIRRKNSKGNLKRFRGVQPCMKYQSALNQYVDYSENRTLRRKKSTSQSNLRGSRNLQTSKSADNSKS
jgi:hypothetical protein